MISLFETKSTFSLLQRQVKEGFKISFSMMLKSCISVLEVICFVASNKNL